MSLEIPLGGTLTDMFAMYVSRVPYVQAGPYLQEYGKPAPYKIFHFTTNRRRVIVEDVEKDYIGMVKPPKSIPHKDHYARISFLYQGSALFANLKKYQVLSRSLARNVDLVSKKTVLKLTPSMKRTICKKCQLHLIPGLNMKIRIENKSKSGDEKNDVLVHQCLTCDAAKRFPIGKDRDYKVFSERDDVAIDVD